MISKLMGLFKRTELSCLHLWGEIIDGYQYCSKCSIARTIECAHVWEVETNHEITRGEETGVIGNEIIYKCKTCTQRKYVRTSLLEEPIVKMI